MTVKKRRRFWVDPPVQAHMLVTVLLLVTGSVLLVSYSMAKGVEAASFRSGQLFHSLDWFLQKMRVPMALSATVSILASGLVALVWSHRFAGPIRVLAAAMDRLKSGDFATPVRVRDNDTLKEITDEFAAMQDCLRGRLASDREHAQAISRRVAAVAQSLPEGHAARPELDDIARETKTVCSDYRL